MSGALPDLLVRAGFGRPASPTGRHPIEVLARTAPLVEEHAVLLGRHREAVAVLASFREDDEARQEAFRALTGTELLILVGDQS